MDGGYDRRFGKMPGGDGCFGIVILIIIGAALVLALLRSCGFVDDTKTFSEEAEEEYGPYDPDNPTF